MANAAEFSADLTKFCDALDVSFEKAVRTIALHIYRGVILKSPVDTGRFRASWTIQEGSANLKVKPIKKVRYKLLSQDGSGKVSATSKVGKGSGYSYTETPKLAKLSSPYTVVWIANGLPYAERLENGWSKQAPAGMVRLTVLEVQQFIKAVVAEADRVT